MAECPIKIIEGGMIIGKVSEDKKSKDTKQVKQSSRQTKK